MKLKSHYNATRYRDRIAEVQAENKEYSDKQAMCKLQERKIQEAAEPQTDEMERLVIVDVYNIEENGKYDKPMDISSVPEPIVKTEDKEDETTEVRYDMILIKVCQINTQDSLALNPPRKFCFSSRA